MKPFASMGALAVLAAALLPSPALSQDRPAVRVAPPAVPAAARAAEINRSELLFRPISRGGVEVFEEPEPSDGAVGAAGAIAPAVTRIAAPVRTATPARTAAAAVDPRFAFHDFTALRTQAARAPAARGAPVCVAPTVTKAGSTCCNYTQPDQLAGTDVTYRQPLKVFGSEGAARQFAATVRASMPMFLPYHDSGVKASHGWIYNGSDQRFHGAVDFSRSSVDDGEDPAFEVRAIADGRVVAVFWDDWSGNIITIEHVAPNGDRFRSNYKHLRNGFRHDLSQARGLPKVPAADRFDDDGNATSKYKYELFAALEDPSELHWGTGAQRIQVAVGDIVRAGQRIGWSGNTGPGGAGAGLNDDGTPKNVRTANNHLHLMIAVPDPTDPGDWVQVDPYGVYNQIADSDCYDLLDRSSYARLFAPFYPSFHNVPAEYVVFYWDYYTDMGLALQTLDLHRRGSELLSSGSFRYGLPAAWYARAHMTGADYQHWFDTYGAQGFRPRMIKVDGGSEPRFTVLWKKREGEPFVAYHGLTDAQWEDAWQQHVTDGGMRVEDRSAYRQGSGRRLAAIFVDEAPSGFYEYHYMTGAEYQQKFNELDAQGWKLVDVEAAELPEGVRFGGIWRQVPGQWVARHGLTPSEYQSAFDDLSEQGFGLHDVQAYDDSQRFIAVWTKP